MITTTSRTPRATSLTHLFFRVLRSFRLRAGWVACEAIRLRPRARQTSAMPQITTEPIRNWTPRAENQLLLNSSV